MPNYCNYEMKIKGSKEAIDRVILCLKADYDYQVGKPEHQHFFRVFQVEVEDDCFPNKDGTFTQFVWGDCAWSVHSAMLKSGYYNDIKERRPDIFMGTDLEEQSKDCEIEVFSEEAGMGFSEHYIYKYGICVCDDCVDIVSVGYNKKGKFTTRINWDTYDGEIWYRNSHRTAPDEPYKWTID